MQMTREAMDSNHCHLQWPENVSLEGDSLMVGQDVRSDCEAGEYRLSKKKEVGFFGPSESSSLKGKKVEKQKYETRETPVNVVTRIKKDSSDEGGPSIGYVSRIFLILLSDILRLPD